MNEIISSDANLGVDIPASAGDESVLKSSATVGSSSPVGMIGGVFTKKLTTDIDGVVIELVSDESSVVYLPVRWATDPRAIEMWSLAVAMLSGAHSAVRKTPWVIGSTWEDIFGNPRSASTSHMEAKAFDMSPMYDESQLLSPRKQLMGLAWNQLSLTYLSTIPHSLAAYVVEGDHLHVQLNGRPDELNQGQVFAVWSKAPWYSIDAIIEGDPSIKRIFGLPFLFDARSVSVQGPSRSLAAKMAYYLGYPGAPRVN